MKKLCIAFIVALALSGCSGNSSSSTSATASPGTYTEMDLNASNVVKMTVESTDTFSNCNIPYVSVTIAVPGSSTTVTIDHILVDTGSTGLRVLKSQIGSLSFSNVATSVSGTSGVLCEMVAFMDGTATWGEVVKADVTMGGEIASSVPIQLISNYYPIAKIGTTSYTNSITQSDLGCNGILGVGMDVDDSDSGYYFSCPSKTITDYKEITTTASIPALVTNPVTKFAVDNNGVLLDLPSVADAGAASVTGYLVFGIGTQTNNIPTGMTQYAANDDGYFTTVYKSVTKNYSFIDSGSNGLYFDDSTIKVSVNNDGFYAPTSTLTLSAVNTGTNSGGSGTVTFKVGNVDKMNGNYSVLPLLCGEVGYNTIFDWGLPFFLGREVFVAIKGKSTTLGTGPYWAY